jgi:hypothetical protein
MISVTIERGCCGCRSLAVKAKLRKPVKPPECGCRDCSMEQMMPGVGGGHCGPMPPDPAGFKAKCVKKACVATPN